MTDEDPHPLRHQVWELAEIRPREGEYQRHRLSCPCWGVTRCAELPPGVPPAQSGPRLIAFTTLWIGYVRQSKRRTAEFLTALLNQPSSTGLTVKHQRIVTASLGPAYQETAGQLSQQPHRGIDETPTKQASQKAWLWTFVADSFTVFGNRLSRAATVLRALLTEDFNGILHCDRAKMNWHLGLDPPPDPLKHRLQWCWAHLKRDVQALIDSPDNQVKRLGHDLMRPTKDLFEVWGRYRDGTITRQDFQRLMTPIRRTIDHLLLRGAFSGNRTAIIDPEGHRHTTLYNASGQFAGRIDPLGNRNTLTYDPDGNPQECVDPEGDVTTSTYDDGQIIRVLNPLGSITTYLHDPMNRITAEIDPLGNRTSYVYEADGAVKATIDPLGHRTTNLYDAEGRPQAVINPLGNRTTFAYDSRGNQVRVQNALGNIRTSVYDSASRLVAAVDPEANRTTFVYDPAGLRTAVVNPLGNRTSTVYDSLSRDIAVIDGLGNRTSFAYDKNGNRVRAENPAGEIATSVYDNLNRTVASVDPLGNRSTTVYDAAGRSVSSVNPLGNRWTTTYDKASRPVAAVDPLDNRTTTVYDTASRPTAQINALGNRSTSVYDDAGRPIASINPLGNRSITVYDDANRAIASVDPLGNRSTTVYDDAGRSEAFLDANGNRSTTVYDAASRTIALVDGRGNRYSFTYDGAGNRTQEIDPLNRRTTLAYDSASRRNLRIDARGNRTTYILDGNDRRIERQYPDGSRATFSYDSVGNRTLMNDSTGRYTTTYDELDRINTIVNPDSKKITYAYDAVGQRKSMVDADGGRFTYSYDADYRIIELINPQGDRTTYTYDVAGRRTVKNLANGTRASFTYDAADNLQTVANLDSAAANISRFDYQYDNIGNRTSVLEVDGSRVTWTYDATNQLLSDRRSGVNAYAQTFTYDPAGNRTLKNEDGARTTFTYDAANQLETNVDAAGTTTYIFDANGNQQVVEEPAGGRTTNTWDFENLNTEVELPSGSMATYTWNADAHRVAKNVDGTEIKMVWDEENILLETDGADATQVVYTLEPQIFGNVISERRKDGAVWVPSYYHFDALDSTRNLTDTAETVTDTWIYDAWGNIVSHTGTSSPPFLWIGILQYYYDPETGQYTIRLRIYGPILARWMSKDPFELADHIKPFVYSQNDPVNSVDPSALTPELRNQCKCPECPDPWNPPPIPGPFENFKYGCYCGVEPTPPRKKIPGPIDAADACCQKHDACCGRATTAAQKKKCNEDLLKCVRIALVPEPENKASCEGFSKDRNCCVEAAKKIQNWYRAAGSKYC